MAASPVNGDRPSPAFRRASSNIIASPQRSFSLHERAVSSQEDADADILYIHPGVRIYHFQPPTDALATLDKSKKTLPDADYPIDAIEILPWRSRTETLSAKGKLIVEKVQGSVHFLKCGSVIHTIMRNSQCWCVDGESKFVMRIGRLRYQRIEMPTAESTDRQKVQEFKEVIGKILRFEKTPCPFIRAFQVDLPEDAITPRRRGTWKRRESLTPTIAEDESPFPRKTKASRTLSMKGLPPSSFPSRSMTQVNMERPRTASTPSHTRFSFPDIRSESPVTYTSGEDGTDSDRPDSASDRAESSHNSEVEESDKEYNTVPIIKSPLKHVEVMSPITDEHSFEQPMTRSRPSPERDHRPLVATRVQTFNEYSLHAREMPLLERRGSLPVRDLSESDPSPHPSLTQSVEVEETASRIDGLGEIQLQDPASQFDRLERFQSNYSEIQSTDPPVQLNHSVDVEKVKPIVDLTAQSSSELVLGEDAHEHDTTDTDSLYERLKEEVQKEVEVVEADRHRSNAFLVFGHDPLDGADGAQHSERVLESHDRDQATSKTAPETASTEGITRILSNDDASSNISTDSFHTMLSDEDLRLTSPRGTVRKRPFSHRREISEMTVTADSTDLDHIDGIEEDDEGTIIPVTPARQSSVDDDDDEMLWPQRRTPGAFEDETEIRRRLRHRRSLSPLRGSISNVESSFRRQSGDGVPAALIQKAANLALVKPLEVVILLVHVFGRIAQGATVNDLLSGDLFRRPGVQRTASGSFDRTGRDQTARRQSEDEDDYAMPLRKSSSSQHQAGPYAPANPDDDAASFASID